MIERASLTRRLARSLAHHAGRALPPARAGWREALLSESEYIASDLAALGWALGCVRAAYAMRISDMRVGHLRPAPALLVLEMLVCFLPLTAVFVAALSYVIASGFHPPAILAQLLAASALGPAGLIVALKPALWRGVPARLSLVVLSVLGTLTVAAFAAAILPAPTWRDGILCVLLPVAGVAHLGGLRTAAAGPAARRR